jgi:hypothetical protein
MDNNTRPSKIYITITNINNVRSEKNCTIKEEAKKINNGGRILLL